MKRYGIFAAAVALLMCIALFAACSGGNVITASLSKSEVAVGEEVTVTYSATEGEVSVVYSKDGGAVVAFTGTAFVPEEPGVYVFTFASEGAENVTRTLTVTQVQEPEEPEHTHSYGDWEIDPVPTADAGGTASRTCSGCEEGEEGHVQTVTLPALNETDYTYEVISPAACGKEGSASYTYKALEGIVVPVTLPAQEHAFDTQLSFTAAEYSEGSHSLSCTNSGCTAQVTVELPALTSEGWDRSDETSATCTQPATATLSRTLSGTGPDGAVSVTVTVTEVQTASALDHSYGQWSIDPVPTAGAGGTASRTCTRCEEGEAGHAQMVTLPALNETDYTYTVISPATCGEEGSASYTYKAQEGIVITVTLAATGEHDFSEEWSSGDAGHWHECSVCGAKRDEAAHSYTWALTEGSTESVTGTCICGHTDEKSITGISVQGQPAYVVAESAAVGAAVSDLSGFTVEAVFEGGSVDITGSAQLSAVLESYSYKSASVRIAFGSHADVSAPLPAYVLSAEGSEQAQTFVGYPPEWIEIGGGFGEFELRFTLSGVTAGPEGWDSWLIRMTAGNGSYGTLRADDYLLDNFGGAPGSGAPGKDNNTENYTFSGTEIKAGDISFVITRTFAEDHYEIVISIAQGQSSATATIVEPVSNGNTMRFAIGGEDCSFSYSDVLIDRKTSEAPAPSAITASPAELEVARYTNIGDVLSQVRIFASYDMQDVLQGADSVEYDDTNDGGYNPVVADTYTVTFFYGELSASVQVTVRSAAYTLLKEYSVAGSEFTDGTTAVSGGSVVNGGFRADSANTVILSNPYYGSALTGFTVAAEIYVNSAAQPAWSPVFGFKSSTFGFLSVAVNDSNQLQLSFNGYSDPISYNDTVILSSLEEGKTYRLAFTFAADGTICIYIDGSLHASVGYGGTYNNTMTPVNFVTSAQNLYLFGGAWGEADTSVWWGGLFDGSLVSLAMYDGIVPGGEVSGL